MTLDHVITIVYYSFTVAFWLAIFFVGRTLLREVRARLLSGAIVSGVILLVLVWFGLVIGTVPGSSTYAWFRYTQNLMGRGCLLGDPQHQYDSERTFQGDGYTIIVFRLSSSASNWLKAPPLAFTQKYPKLPWFRNGWTSVPWHATPIAENENEFLEFALVQWDKSQDNAGCVAAQGMLRTLAHEPGNYLAYNYQRHDKHVGNVDFFLVSPTAGVLIIVNFNT